MKAGKLRQVIEIQGLPPSGMERQDADGQPIDVPQTSTTVRGDVEPLSGREYFNAQQLVSEVSTRVTIRYIKGLTTKNRLKIDHTYYDILDVIDVDLRHKELQLMCRTGLIDVNG